MPTDPRLLSEEELAEIQRRAALTVQTNIPGQFYDPPSLWHRDRMDLLAHIAALTAERDRLRVRTERLYWYSLMLRQGGPDGTDLDSLTEDDGLAAIAWAEQNLPALAALNPEADRG
jgi:hypothetical protein